MLHSLKESIQAAADTISQVTGLDVEVVDTQLVRVAGTGIYGHSIGKSITKAGNLLKATLTHKEVLFIDNPREHIICDGCPSQTNCQELLSLCAPIADSSTIYGAIELVCFSQEAKERVLAQKTVYCNFLLLLAQSFAHRVHEKFALKDVQNLLNTMSEVISANDKGIIVFDVHNSVSYHNERAQIILKKFPHLHKKHFSITKTGATFSGLQEYLLKDHSQQQLVVGKILPLQASTQRLSQVFAFDTIQSTASLSTRTSSYEDDPLDHIIGQSPPMTTLKDQIRSTALTTSSVLILGESGTGKELVARAIHALGDRAHAPFVAINCGAIPELLLESELFGYVGGAFTGALRAGKIGTFEMAEGGVIFLDEISSMPLYLQVKLLRVLQERTITRLGATQCTAVDIRVIAATNDNLHELMAANMFRPDLFFRLNVIPLTIAPLRQRKKDIDLLTTHFVKKYCSLFGKESITLPKNIILKIRNYSWPGNVRELENAIEYLVNMADSNGKIMESFLSEHFLEETTPCKNTPSTFSDSAQIIPLKELERQAIEHALHVFGKDTQGKKKAAVKLGISLATLYRKLQEMRITG